MKDQGNFHLFWNVVTVSLSAVNVIIVFPGAFSGKWFSVTYAVLLLILAAFRTEYPCNTFFSLNLPSLCDPKWKPPRDFWKVKQKNFKTIPIKWHLRAAERVPGPMALAPCTRCIADAVSCRAAVAPCCKLPCPAGGMEGSLQTFLLGPGMPWVGSVVGGQQRPRESGALLTGGWPGCPWAPRKPLSAEKVAGRWFSLEKTSSVP